jgi:tetratricopeptide (TPR) repeat protein
VDLPVKRLATTAIKVAAITQLGPLAGGLFVSGAAVFVKHLAEDSDWAAGAEMLMHLSSHAAAELFGSAAEGFRGLHNGDLEKSMHQAAREALEELRHEAPPGFGDWFEAWRAFLAMKPPEEVFAAAPVDPVALEYDDQQFRHLWWACMEPVLAGWRHTEESSITRLHLEKPLSLPPALADFLRDRLPEAMQAAHSHVLREKKLEASWIGFQQHVYRDALNYLHKISTQLDRIEAKIDGSPHRPAAVWSIPRPTEHFQDRPDLIAQIDAALERHDVTALTALHGLGGIGKTQMARRYAELRRDRYKVGVYIESENEASLLASFSAVARLMRMPPEQDQQALAQRVVNEISTGERYLAIFDNAVSAEALRPWLERLSGPGHVLITSRDQHWDDCAQVVSVTEWSIPESVKFLLERTCQTDQAAAEGLAQDLGGLVLALEHAAAYMLAGDQTPLAEYRRIWREKLKREAKGHAYQRSVAAALGLSMDAVAAQSQTAYDLLSVFAWLAPDRIPRKELLEAGAAKLPESLATAFADRDRWNDAIETLRRYALLRREPPHGMATGYFLHRVVLQVMRDRLADAGTASQWLAAACDLVDAAFPFDSDEVPYWEISEALLPHARAIRGSVRLSEAPGSLGRLLNQAGLYLRVRGLYGQSRDFHTVTLESGLLQLGPDHPSIGVRRSNLALTLHDLGEYVEARKQIVLALESDLRHFGPDHGFVARDRSNLSMILEDLGEYEEARKQIELALKSDLKQHGPAHRSVAVRRSNLANILRQLGEHAQAKKQIELALESDLRQLGLKHPLVALRRLNLAPILRALGEYAEARRQIELALESNLQQLGSDHPTVAVNRVNLAVILQALCESQAALSEIDLALEIFRKRLPPGHPSIRNAEDSRETILRALESAPVGPTSPPA